MSDTTYDPADPRLTAYVLGELDDAERQDVEQQLEQCAESRAAVEEIRETVGLVTSALAAEPAETLTDEQRTAITAEAAVPAESQPKRQTSWRGAAASFVSGVVATAAMILLVLPQLHRSSGDRSPAMNGENSIIATSSTGSRYGDEEIVFELNTEVAEAINDVSTLVADAQTTAEALRRNGRHGQHRPAEVREPSVSTSGYSVQPGGKFGAHARRRSGQKATNQPPPGSANGVPQTEIPRAGESTTLQLANDGEKVPPPTARVKRSTGTGDGTRLTIGRQLTGETSGNIRPSFHRPIPSTQPAPLPVEEPSVITGTTGVSNRYHEQERFAKVPIVDPNQIEYSKKRFSANGLFTPDVDVAFRNKAVDGEDGISSEQYQPIIENPFLSPNNDPLSTFSIDVDTASYSNVRRFLKQNQFPPANAVRIEELVNYFHYDYAEPTDGRPFSVNLEAGPCPWNSEHRLVRVGLKGKEIDKSQRPPSNLVFLLDVSGSMRDSNKLPLVKTAMEMLVSEMTEDDRIAIVTYAGKAGVRLPSTSGQDKTRIIDAIHALSAGGSTNGEAGIKLAYEQAVGHFIDDGANRVILCTDGDFNVGTSGDKELVTLIQKQAKSKVFLSVFGFGMGNLKDGKLEQIADKGNGQYGYIDNEKEAHKVFVEEMAGTLYTIAKDVKIQVEFNPQQVGGYRLIGYENRMLAAPDFNDDTKDAGEIGAGHTVTALYEIVPFNKLPAAKPVDNLKYQKPVKVNDDDKVAQELLTVKLRYKQPDADQSVKIDFTLTDNKPQTKMPSVDFEWAASCAGFGLLLRNSQYRGQADFDLIRELAMGSRGNDESGRRREFLDLVFTAHAMHARATGQPIPPRESLPEDKAREMAQVQGKYQKLLKRIEMPTDAATYGQFTDFGYWAGNAWGNHKDLPKGHWVYVAPHWYIWGDSTAKKSSPSENE